MTLQAIPFEIHITTRALQETEIAAFVTLCAQLEAKPLLIELSRGQYVQQPMLTKVVRAHNWEQVSGQVQVLVDGMHAAAMNARRIKIEIPASDAGLFSGPEGSTPYFEWHGKVNYTNIPGLMEVCTQHTVHLSLNALKEQDGFRFVTLREYGSKKIFEARIAHLRADLLKGGWTVTKEQSEYCIFDNNELLDKDWLQLS